MIAKTMLVFYGADCLPYKDIERTIHYPIVEPAFQGKGIAKALLDAAVAYARENGLKIHAVCSYVVRQFEKPEYDDVNSRK